MILIVANTHPKNAIKKLSRSFMNGCPIQQKNFMCVFSDKKVTYEVTMILIVGNTHPP